MRWIVCQIGAREHYAVARALWRREELVALVTDLWMPSGKWARRLPGGNSLSGRHAKELDGGRVLAPNVRMLAFALQARLGRWSKWRKILAENALFQREALKILRNEDWGDMKPVLFAYSYAARNLFREAKMRGWQTVLGQIDPGPGEQRLVDELRRQHPEWAGDVSAIPPPSYWSEWREECDLADRIVVNSEWSRSLLTEEGIPAEKIDIVPLAYEAEGRGSGKKYPERFTKERPMRILFLGQANVRKGIQDLVCAARRLGEGPWRFDVVGRHPALPPDIPPYVLFHGQVPRDEAAGWYDKADIFVLPTHSDGFALTQLEAMAHGLPVVATPCCGRVVVDGENGRVVPSGDAAALAEVIRQLAANPRGLAVMSGVALKTVDDYSIDRAGEVLAGERTVASSVLKR